MIIATITVGVCCLRHALSLRLSQEEKKPSITSSARWDRSSLFEPLQRRDTSAKVPMDRGVFEDICGGASRGKSRFDVTAVDLDITILFPDGWSKRAFRTSTKCIACREQPIWIRLANQRKSQYDQASGT